MSNLSSGAFRARFFKALFASGLLVLTVSGTSQAAPGDASADETERTSVSTHYATGGRQTPSFSAETEESYSAFDTDGERVSKATRGGLAKPGSGSTYARKAGSDFWVFDADVMLFNDDDNDGYYHGIDLAFDADTVYSAARVYAVLYLSQDFGPWNEYAETKDFWLFGASGDDEYVLVTELMSGYPAGDYDLLIELFDADDHSFLASFGPEDSSGLGFLPLEDFKRDEPIQVVQVTTSRGGGGSASGWTIGFLLLMLFGSAVRKIWRHRKDALVRIDSPPPCWQVTVDRKW